MSERSAEDRERARLEREARRKGMAADLAAGPARAPGPKPKPKPEPEVERDPTPAPEPPPPIAPPPALAPPPREPEPELELEHEEVPLGTRRAVRPSDSTRARAPARPRAGATSSGPRRRISGGRILAVGALLAIAVAIWFLISLFEPGKGGGNGSVALTVPAGAGARQIGDLLAQRGVVGSGFFFSLRTRLSNTRDELRSGTYTLKEDMSYASAIDALTTPPKAAPTRTVTIPEGPSVREAAPLVKEAGLRGSYVRAAEAATIPDRRALGVPADVQTPEGLLFPDTYELKRRQATSERLVALQLATFRERLAQVDLSAARRKNLTPYDVTIIASMVEREARIEEERPIIAGVIYNRLRDDIALGIDATTRYALNNWDEPLTDADFPASGAYNTRANLGLPPTPIGNPGLSSLQAAAKPARTPYLYYVVKPGTCGRHTFTRTYDEFLNAANRYEQARQANGGRSPDSCEE